MPTSLASRLTELEASKFRHGRGCAAAVETLLVSMKGAPFGDAESLIRFHDALLFLRAFPQSRKVVQLTESLLSRIAQKVARLSDSDADMTLFDSEQFSGMAGTVISDSFTYEVTRWSKPTRRSWNGWSAGPAAQTEFCLGCCSASKMRP